MENITCSEGRTLEDGIPDVLMADDVAREETVDEKVEEVQDVTVDNALKDTHTGGDNSDLVDIETCDQLSDRTKELITKHETIEKQDPGAEDDEELEALSYDLAQGNRILSEIMSDANKTLNWPFMDPVDTEAMGLSDYHERVKEPMWLKKMREKFEKREYANITEFARDFRLMLENCYRYNGPDHYISKRGQKLETVFEQKLGLLSRDLREKTSIAATSGKPLETTIISGTRRRKILTPHDSSELLNQLRQEEKHRERENRKQLVEERRQQQQAFIQELLDWEDKLLGPGGRDYLYAMWEMPQIGHFLFLTAEVLNTGEVMQWELERSFWIPNKSSVLQIVMTSLLSTPYQRTRLDTKPPMPYKVWEEKLRTRVRNWYKVFKESNHDTKKTHLKIGLDEKFFKIVGLTNPLEKRKFHELTFYQRVWIVKSLCDWCLATQESIREAIEAQPLEEQREYHLGIDADGNKYIHFPQFCGQDLRVYRIAPIQMPKIERPKVKKEEEMESPKKKVPGKTRRPVFQSRTPPNTKTQQITHQRTASRRYKSSESSSDSGINESETSDTEEPSKKSRRKSLVNRSTPVSKPSSSTTTPTKGRSSRTSAAAREWMPRDVSFMAELTGHRSSRSQRLTCAPVNSGTNTPTTCATASCSPETTPLPAKESSSCSSTPSVDSSSRTSSPHKQPTSSKPQGSRKRWRKPPQRSLKAESHESDEETVDSGEKAAKPDEDEKNVNMQSAGKLNEIKVNGDTHSNNGAYTDSQGPNSIEDPDVRMNQSTIDIHQKKEEIEQEVSCVNGLEPVEAYDTQIGIPISSSLAKESLPCNGPETSDTTQSCDMDANNCVSLKDKILSDLPDGASKESGKSVKRPNNLGVSEQFENKTKALSSLSEKHSYLNGDSSKTQKGFNKCEEGKREYEKTFGLKKENNHSGDMDPLCGGVIVKTPDTDPGQGIFTMELGISIKQEPVVDVPLEDGTWESENHPELYEGLAIKSEPISNEIEAESTPLPDVKMELGKHTLKEELPDKGAISVIKQEEEIKKEPALEPKQEVQQQQEVMPGQEINQEEDEVEIEPEIKFPEVGPFLMIADSVEQLRALSLQFAEPEPIIQIKGKKEKVLRPPPRKRCVSDLYDRMTYLLKELEPWESKLVAVNRKARIKLRKEVESYVDTDVEDVEDVWESEESQSEDSDENKGSDDDDDDDEDDIVNIPVKEIKKEHDDTVTTSPEKSLPKTPKKVFMPPIILTEAIVSNDSSKTTNDPEKSSYGRIRKRKVIPNAYDEPPVNKKKRVKDKEKSPSPSPNILVNSRAKSKSGVAEELNSINSLRSALSKAKPVSTSSALPPGMQLLNIGGQNVLFNSSTNPPVILQTSAPLNLNNLALLAQLSAKAAAGNTLSSKIVVKNVSSASTATSSGTGAGISKSTRGSHPPQQVIRTLLAAGHASQHPKPEITHPSTVPPTRPITTPLTANSVLGQTTTVKSSVPSGTSIDTSLSPSSIATEPTLLQASAGSDSARPQFYKYNDMSQMKATIRQQLVKTSQGVRTKSTVCTMPAGSTALSNLIQAGLLPQSPCTTLPTMQPALAQSNTESSSDTEMSIPVKTESVVEQVTTYTSAPVAPLSTVTSVEGKPASILSKVLASTGPGEQTPSVLHTTNIPAVSKALTQQNKSEIQLQQPLHQKVTELHGTHVVSHQKSVKCLSTQSLLKSPTSENSQTKATAITSPQKLPAHPQILPKGLSPEVKAAVKMGLVNESNIGSLIHANPGLVKVLNNTMKPKYASNVTVKSLLENRALRQRAHQHGELETSNATGVTLPIVPASPQKSVASPIKVQNLNIPVENKAVAIQIHNVNPKQQIQSQDSLISGISPPHIVISAKTQPTHKPKVLQLQAKQTDGQVQKPITTVSKMPLQLKAVQTSQGTILQTISGQQVTVQPAGPRLQVCSPGQPMMRLISPAGGDAVQLMSSTLPISTKQVFQPEISLDTSTTFDEVVKSVVTSVHCSIPATPQDIGSPLISPGQIRQVTSTTNTMKSPIPSVTPLAAAETSGQTSISQTPVKFIVSPHSTNAVQGTVVGSNAGISRTTGQKNLMLRMLPSQQHMMTSKGLVSVVVPQQMLRQSLKSEGEGEEQLAQVEKVHDVLPALTLTAQPSAGSVQPMKTAVAQSSTKSFTAHAPQLVKSPVKPPSVADPVESALTTVKSITTGSKAPMLIKLEPQACGIATPPLPIKLEPQASGVAKSLMQIKLEPQASGILQPTEVLSGQQHSQLVSPTMVMKRANAGSSSTAAIIAPLSQTSEMQPPQVISKVSPSVQKAMIRQSNIQEAQPQLMLCSSGLGPVQNTQTQPQRVPIPNPTTAQVNKLQPLISKPETTKNSPEFIEHNRVGEVTSSLDLLAAASLLQEAKAPLPNQTLPEIKNSNSQLLSLENKTDFAQTSPNTDDAFPQQATDPAYSNTLAMNSSPTKVQQSQNKTSDINPQAAVGHDAAISSSQQHQLAQQKTTTIPLTKFHQEQAKVLEQQIKLQQKMLQEQQKQQKLIRQLTLQQEVALGGSSMCTTQSSAAQIPALATAATVKTAATTTVHVQKPVSVGAVSGGSSLSGLQMAGVMASAGGKMVQLRFAVPAGMTVQQLLHTPQFQQQLASLKVSAIHGITTSTVATTTTVPSVLTNSVASSSKKTVLSPSKNQPKVCEAFNVPLTTMSTGPAGTVLARLVTPTPKPKLSVASAGTRPVLATTSKAGGSSGLTLTQSPVGTTHQSGNKRTVLVSVNGQLVQAQGLSLKNNICIVSSGTGTVATVNSPPKVFQAVGTLPNGAKIVQTVNTPGVLPSQHKLLTSTTQTMLRSPAKVTLQPRTATPHIVASTTPHILKMQTGTGNVISSVQVPQGITLQDAAKANLLKQFASVVSSTETSDGTLLAKPVLASSASSQLPCYSSATTQGKNLPNGR